MRLELTLSQSECLVMEDEITLIPEQYIFIQENLSPAFLMSLSRGELEGLRHISSLTETCIDMAIYHKDRLEKEDVNEG